MSELLTLGRVRLLAGDGTATATPAQPKRLALLTYLTLVPGGGLARRDALLALFWPELGDDDARRALRQALYYLRRVIGDVIVSEGDEVGVRGESLRCDAIEFELLIEAGHPATALDLYRGDFLEGFHVDDVSPEYEEWVERTRARLRRRAAGAAWAAADRAEKAADPERAIASARRACELEPDQESGWRRLMALHERLGDRAGALREFEERSQRLAREFDAKPSPETMALAEAIRMSSRPADPPVDSRQLLSPGSAPPPLGGAGHGASGPAYSDGEPTTLANDRARPRRGSRSVLLSGAAAVVVLAAGWLAYNRIVGAREGSSLVAEGALARTDRLVVADFADQVGDPLLAAAVTEAFRVDLSQSPLVRVLSPRDVRGTLARMERPANAPLDDSLASEVAARTGAKAFVTGSVARVGSAYTVSVRLVDAARGEILSGFRATAADSSELIEAVDRVSKQLRHRIGESLGELRDNLPLEVATTASLDALRRYTEATRLMLDGKRTEAIGRYEAAIALDSGFAAAHLSLGMAYASIADPGRAFAAAQRALAHQDRLPFLERRFTIASNAAARRDFDTAIDAYRRVLERYPDEFRAMNNLALIHRDRREFATAESLFVRATTVDSTIANLYFGIHSTQVLRGEFAESRRTLDLVARRFPGNTVLTIVEMQDAAAQQNWDLAERHAETTIAASQADTLSLVDPFEALAAIAMTQGQLAEAERRWRTHLALSAAAGTRARHLYGVIMLANLHLRYRDTPARALALVDSALGRTPLDSLLPGDRLYDELARFYATAGRMANARELVAAAEANDRLLARNLAPDRAWTRGVIALAERHAEAAERDLRLAADAHFCTICALPDLARAYEMTGKRDAAVLTYERYVTTPWLWRYEVDATELGWALQRLAELYDARGEPEKATAARARLAQLWRRADPELQPVVAAARERLGTEPR